MKYRFTTERFIDAYDESVPLTQKHHEEINLFGIPLDVYEELYIQLEKDSKLATFVIRDSAHKMVGYGIFILYIPTHHRGSLHAKQDVLFIVKEHRGIGREFLEYCDEQLRTIGIHFVHHSVPKLNDWSKVLFELGYTETETLYTRRLQWEQQRPLSQ